MNIYSFVKLILRHFYIIVAVPVAMAFLVYWMTKDEPKLFSSETEIYTGIASGYDVDMKQGMGDRFMVQSVFENILTIMKSKAVNEEVALRLMAQHLALEKQDNRIASKETMNYLKLLVPDSLVKKLVTKGNQQKTYEALNIYMQKDVVNPIYRILNSPTNHYSFAYLNQLSYKRVKSSDIVKITYKSTDPGVCVNTLMLFSEVFIRHYRDVKLSETGDIVKYFEQQLIRAENKLNGLEEQLLDYRSSNNILDYTEQARAIAQRRQEMEGLIYEEKMKLGAAQRTVDYAQEQLDLHLKILSKNSKIIEKRNKLERLAADAGFYRAFSNSPDSLAKIEAEIDALREEMENDLSEIFSINYTTSGVQTRDILKEWFNNVISVGESQARLKIYDQRSIKFQELYATMAPVGSNLTKIERKVGVAESEYLRILEALNLAKLREQNIAISTKLKVVEQARFPTRPDPSQQKMLLIIGFLVGLAVIVSVLVLLEFVDQTIKYPAEIVRLTELKLAGVYPFFPKKMKGIYPLISQRLDYKIGEEIKNLIENKKSPNIAIISFLDTEGKGMAASRLATQLAKTYDNTGLWSYQELNTEEGLGQQYELENLEKEPFPWQGTSGPQVIEFPPLQHYRVPYDRLKEMDAFLLVVRSNRSWQKSDKQLLARLKELLPVPPLVLLNGVRVGYVEDVLGPLPKKRSRLRRMIRRLLKLEFG